MKTRALTLLGLLALGTGAAAQDRLPSIPQTLSLQDALELSEQYSPVYAQTLNNRSPAAWGVRNAYGSFLPTFNVSSSTTYSGAGTQRFATTDFIQPSATIGSSYNLSLAWTLNGNTLLQPGVQKAALSAADASIDASRMSLRKLRAPAVHRGLGGRGPGGVAGTAGRTEPREPPPGPGPGTRSGKPPGSMSGKPRSRRASPTWPSWLLSTWCWSASSPSSRPWASRHRKTPRW